MKLMWRIKVFEIPYTIKNIVIVLERLIHSLSCDRLVKQGPFCANTCGQLYQ